MKKLSFLLLFLFLSFISIGQGHFTPVSSGNGSEQMTINILGATSGGLNLQTDDEIAVFDGSICCGVVILTKPVSITDYVSIAASKNDAVPANGYTAGNAITYKFWDSSENKEIFPIAGEYFNINTIPATTIVAPTFTTDLSAFVKLYVNRAPTATAGADQSVNEGTLVTLDGSASSDPDGNTLTYLWVSAAGVTLSSTTVAKPTFTAPEVMANTNYTFTLIVNDGNLSSTNYDPITVTVKQVNKAPVANAGLDNSVNGNTLYTLDGSGSTDADNDPLTYKWTAPAGILLSSITIAKPFFTSPTVTDNTDYTFTLVVNDGVLDSPTDQVKITVKVGNKAPVANAGSDQSVNENTQVILDGSASSDPDNDQLTYLWTALNGITLSSTTIAKPTFTAPEVTANTTYTFSLVVKDGTLSSPADLVVITVKQVNKVPVANAGPDQSINENTLVTLDGSASSDGDGSALSYKWTAPAGITLSSTTAAKPTFTAPEISKNTDYILSLVVNDGTADSPADQVTITVNNTSATQHFLPAFTGYGSDQMVINVLSAKKGDLDLKAGDEIAVFDGSVCCGMVILTKPVSIADYVSIAASKNDAVPANGYTAGHAITYKFWDKSAGLEITTISPEYFDPISAQPVTVPTYTAMATAFVKLSVNHAPTSNAGTDQNVNEGTLVTLDGTASSDPDGNTLTYLWTAPTGVTLNSTTVSKPTFTAPEVTANTDYTFTLMVNDGNLNSTSDQITVTVKQVNKAPVANAGLDNSVNVNTSFTLDGSASSDPEGNPITYKWTAPTGITLSSTTAEKPTFTSPTVTANTVYTFSLIVNDGVLDSPADLVKITVKAGNQAPVANAGPDQSVNEGTLLVTLDGSNSSDPDTDPLTYLWTALNGITLSSTTVAKPTFTAPEVTANTTYTFSLVVNDGTVASTADQVVITVNQVNKVPVANAGPDQSINENTLVTMDGSASSDGDGSTLTYKWTAPTGITLSSTTDAKPTFTAPEVTANTNYTISLIVNDGTADSPADQVVITVNNTSSTRHFVPAFEGNGQNHMNIYPMLATIGDIDLDADDEIAAFDGAICVGIVKLTESINSGNFFSFAIPASQKEDNVSPVNGYTTGHAITFKFWDKSEKLEFSSVIPEYFAKTGQPTKAPTYMAGESAYVKLSVILVPTANAGPDQTINEGSTVTLDGTASSATSGGTLTYLWTAPSGITLSSTTASNPTFTAPEVAIDTDYSFSLVVTGGTTSSTADLVVVKVKQVNKVPVANAGPDQTVDEGSAVILDGSSSSDGDNDVLTYLWTAPSGITLSSATTNKPTFTAPAITTDTDFTLSLVVNDGKANSPADQVKIRVKLIPKHFKKVWTGNGNDHMNIHIGSAKLDGVDLEAGDEIGIFDGTICVGAGILTGTIGPTNILNIVVSKDDGSGNGFTAENSITFILYDKSKDAENKIVTPEYKSDDPSWSTDGKFAVAASAFPSLNFLTKITQLLSFNIGWNLMSAYVVPSNLNLKDILQPLIDGGSLKKVMDETGKSIENFGAWGGWKNSIGDLVATEGYKVNMISAGTLSIEGIPVPLPKDIILNTGWNIISYACATEQDAKALFQPLIDSGKLKKVMDETGKSIENFGAWGGWKNSIGNLLPGKGYKVDVTAPCTLTIPKTATKSATFVPEVLASSHFTKVFIGNGTEHFNIHLVELTSSGLQAGDQIGIFDGKYCVGAAEIGTYQLMAGNISIPASSNEDSPDKVNGFTEGHPVTLQLYRANLTYLLNQTKLSGTESFEKNGSLFLKVVASDLPTNQINTALDQLSCYPNPFADQLTIDIRLTEPKKLEVNIYNLSGKLVRHLYLGQAGKLESLIWDGTNGKGAKVMSGTYLLKANEMTEKIVFKK